jgi:two-component system, NarL family, response regulator LiaR
VFPENGEQMIVSVLLVDDHIILRKGIKSFLEATSDLHVAGEASSGEEALQLLKSLNPDVIVMDYVMPGMGGLETIRQIKQRFPGKPVIILSLYVEKAYVQAAVEAGACSYLLKEDISAHLTQAIRDAAVGVPHFSPILDKKSQVLFKS